MAKFIYSAITRVLQPRPSRLGWRMSVTYFPTEKGAWRSMAAVYGLSVGPPWKLSVFAMRPHLESRWRGPCLLLSMMTPSI